ncbi:hypothetical protein [Actinomadura fibrosa]|uniref:Uncharacterized protein n=1 Tax=Actinomadura fibrosa TaxID=111802 RepID=A0ABW2Y2L5_9ACTN|nr:hypothetical protein [Actinomadura fibrosa]
MAPTTVLIEIRYAGAQQDERDAAKRALAAALDVPGADVAAGPGNTVQVRATLEADGPLDAAGLLDEALARALMAAGLFEEFDVARRLVHAAPTEEADRLFAWSAEFSARPAGGAGGARRGRGWCSRRRRRGRGR